MKNKEQEEKKQNENIVEKERNKQDSILKRAYEDVNQTTYEYNTK